MGKVIRRETLLTTRRFRVCRVHYSDDEGHLCTRETIEHPGAVVVIPVVSDSQVCLIRNYRVALDRQLIELPAGTLEGSESPEATARRELAEETGYLTETVQPLCEFFMSPGILNERMLVYVARDLQAGRPAREPGEMIDNLLFRFDEVDEAIRQGRIVDAKTIAAWLYFRQFST
ncbi:MAG: ADP-ribose pyrophosphatase [Pirellulaceae bacterium]|nr:MAG: ADP-ribose pyrophosphatase [Pirellulaceae bacterium]